MEDFDIALSFDTTGSMSSCIGTVKTSMKDIMRKLKRDIPNIRMAVIAHGDYDTDDTYVIKYADFTDVVGTLCSFVNSAEGTRCRGPHLNYDEAYELSLRHCQRYLNWRPAANRVLVMIGDRNPHGPNYPLNKQRIDWRDEIKRLREMDVKIYAVQCKNKPEANAFYQTISSQTFGHHVSLSDIRKIEEVLMGICYRENALLKNFTGCTTQTVTQPVVLPPPTSVLPNSNDERQETYDEEDGGSNGKKN